LQKKIYDKNLSQMLEALCDAGFLWKFNGQYSVADPVLRRALLTLTEKEILRKLATGTSRGIQNSQNEFLSFESLQSSSDVSL
jgi:hypothetical protein